MWAGHPGICSVPSNKQGRAPTAPPGLPRWPSSATISVSQAEDLAMFLEAFKKIFTCLTLSPSPSPMSRLHVLTLLLSLTTRLPSCPSPSSGWSLVEFCSGFLAQILSCPMVANFVVKTKSDHFTPGLTAMQWPLVTLRIKYEVLAMHQEAWHGRLPATSLTSVFTNWLLCSLCCSQTGFLAVLLPQGLCTCSSNTEHDSRYSCPSLSLVLCSNLTSLGRNLLNTWSRKEPSVSLFPQSIMFSTAGTVNDISLYFYVFVAGPLPWSLSTMSARTWSLCVPLPLHEGGPRLSVY